MVPAHRSGPHRFGRQQDREPCPDACVVAGIDVGRVVPGEDLAGDFPRAAPDVGRAALQPGIDALPVRKPRIDELGLHHLERQPVAEEVAVAEGADLAIVDMQVGSMGGMAITRALKGAVPGVGSIVLLLDRRADAFIARRAGADAWLLKPFAAQELRSVLAGIVPVGVDR